MKIGMTRGTKRLLDLGRKSDLDLDAALIAGIDKAIDGSIDEKITDLIHFIPLGEATLQFFLEADMDKVMLAASYVTPVLAIDASSMSVHAVPETKRVMRTFTGVIESSPPDRTMSAIHEPGRVSRMRSAARDSRALGRCDRPRSICGPWS